MRPTPGFFAAAAFALLVQSLILDGLPPIQLVKYSHAAELFLQGQLSGERLLDFSPLYLQLNIILQRFDAPKGTLLWINLICSALSTGFLYRLLRQNFTQVVWVIGILIFVLDRSLLVYTHTFEPEAVVMLFLVAGSFFITRQHHAASFLGGLCWGLGLLTRPNFLPALLAVPFYYKWNSGGRNWIKNTVLVLLPPLLCLGGLWIRNWQIAGYFTPVVMNPGTALYEGNNSISWGTSSIYPPVLHQFAQQYSNQPDYHHQLYREIARRTANKRLSVPEVNQYWTLKAFHSLKDNFVRTTRLVRTKAMHFFHSYLWHDLSTAYSAEQTLKKIWPFSFPFSIVAAAALAGLAILVSQWKRYLIFYAVFFVQFIFMMTIYISSRQRVSILFLFLFFACGALQFVLDKRRRWAMVIAFIALLSIPLQMRTDLMREEDHLWNTIRQSNALMAEAYRLRNDRKIEQATIKASQAVTIAPFLWDSRRPSNVPFSSTDITAASKTFEPQTPSQWMDRALLYLELGLPEPAEKLFVKLEEMNFTLKRDQYQSSELKFYIARCAAKQGQHRRAVTVLERALKNSPADPSTLSYLSVLKGGSEYEQTLLRYFNETDAAFFLGKAHLDAGDPKLAVRHFEYLTQELPEFRKGHIYLAAALSRDKRYEQASRAYRKAISMNPDPVFYEDDILTVFEQIASRRPTSFNHYSNGVVLRQFGHFARALQQQQAAATLDPSNPQIASEIRQLQAVIGASVNRGRDNGAP